MLDHPLDDCVDATLARNPRADALVAVAKLRNCVTPVAHNLCILRAAVHSPQNRPDSPLLAHDVLLCNGSAVVPEITGKRPAFPSLDMLGNGSLSQHDLVNLAGNGWHIPAVGKVIVWLLASVREHDCALRRVVDPGDFDDDAEEEVI